MSIGRTGSSLAFFAVLSLALSNVESLGAQGYTLQWSIGNPTPESADLFGTSVAISGSRILVGATDDNSGGFDNTGSAYLYDLDSGSLLQSFNNPTPSVYEVFGFGVAISGNMVAISTPYEMSLGFQVGAVYIYDALSGSLLRTINNPFPTTNDQFGFSIALEGNILAVGAIRDDVGATDSGTAYIYDASTGALLHTLNNPSPESGDYFGFSVAISGDRLVVSSRDDNTGAAAAGSVYVYDVPTGSLLRTINNPLPDAGDRFGASVGIDGDAVLVGSPGDQPLGIVSAGSAYLFDGPTGTLIATLNSPIPSANERFGRAVALSGSRALVGMAEADIGAVPNVGVAYLFDAADGTLLSTVDNPEPTAGDEFSVSVALSDTVLVIGTHQDDPGGITDSGSVYTFTLTETPTPTPSSTPTPSPTPSPTFSPTPSSSPTASPTPSATPTPFGVASICNNSNLDGKCRAGNRTLIKACIIPPSAKNDILQVQFEYRPTGAGPWFLIPNANINHPNPDLNHPFFVHWDLTVLPNGDYDVRAVSTDVNFLTDPSPSFITFTVDTNCGHKENLNPQSETEVESPVFIIENNIVQGGHDDQQYAIEVDIPATALSSDTSLILTCRDPSSSLPIIDSLLSINAFVDLTLVNGQTSFVNSQRATLTFEYADNDSDGIVDGLGVPEDDLMIYWWDGGAWQVLPDSAVNSVLDTISATTDHFTTFAVLAPMNAARNWELYQ